MNLEKELQEVGLQEKEAKVYIAMLELGRATAQDIAKKADVNRATTYFVMENLMKKGLASAIDEGPRQYFLPEDPSQLEAIFETFKEGSLFYWHDVGHAEVAERLGFSKHRELLDKFANRLIGVHLHDIIGPTGDHKVPGAGTFDFNMIKPYLKSDTIKVIEVHRPATGEEIRRGAEYLARIFN